MLALRRTHVKHNVKMCVMSYLVSTKDLWLTFSGREVPWLRATATQTGQVKKVVTQSWGSHFTMDEAWCLGLYILFSYTLLMFHLPSSRYLDFNKQLTY